MIGLEDDPVAVAEIDHHMLVISPNARPPRHEILGGSGSTHICQPVLENLSHAGTQFELCLVLALADAADGFGVKGKFQRVGPSVKNLFPNLRDTRRAGRPSACNSERGGKINLCTRPCRHKVR